MLSRVQSPSPRHRCGSVIPSPPCSLLPGGPLSWSLKRDTLLEMATTLVPAVATKRWVYPVRTYNRYVRVYLYVRFLCPLFSEHEGREKRESGLPTAKRTIVYYGVLEIVV